MRGSYERVLAYCYTTKSLVCRNLRQGVGVIDALASEVDSDGFHRPKRVAVGPTWDDVEASLRAAGHNVPRE